MASILLLTNASGSSVEILPALELLAHSVHILPAEASALLDAGDTDVVMVDARRDLSGSRSLCQLLRTTGLDAPILLVLTEGGMAAVSALWQADDVLLDTAGPAEVEARLRLATARSRAETEADTSEIRAAGVVIDEASYTAKVHGEPLNLTYKEFELLKYLAQHPGRVFTRDQLLHEVWGYDYYGGTRTVDVHVRRLRAKLGADHEQLIGTVRNVGYRFTLARTLDDEDTAQNVGA
ncbi:two-component system response regulator GlnR [Arthrobacter ginkgonis]|uniref:Two-component system response regulator GlnR n=1 Tax=Arthrobacter ginkgonis TaxID=1630594 RepID=A0ABP7C1P0_9MICC